MNRGGKCAAVAVIFFLAVLCTYSSRSRPGSPFILHASSLAADDPTQPDKLQMALDKLNALKKAPSPDLDALQLAYLVVFENFPRHQKGKEAIFELYNVLRRAKRTDQAYAALLKIEGVYQDNETMAYPPDTSRLVGMVATARLEEAFLYASQMQNPFQAVDGVNAVLLRWRDQLVGVAAPDRSYLGRVEAVARLQLALYRLQAEATNLAANDLLALGRDWPGEAITIDGFTQNASIAAVRALPPALAAMPASLAKKLRLLETFEQTLVDESARVWLLFERADLNLNDYETNKNRGSFADGVAALREIVDKRRATTIADENGAEPAGVRALRRLRDAEARLGGNVAQAGQTLSDYYARFADDAKQKTFAAYALLYLAELDLDFRDNAAEAFKEFMTVADRYGDALLYPQPPGKETTIREHALRWAKRAQERK
jgi:hypothetical protein